MEGLLIVLIGLLLGATTCLVRYYLAVKSLSKQIEEKLVEESHRRITLKNQPKSLVTLKMCIRDRSYPNSKTSNS